MLSNLASDVRNLVNFDDNSADNDEANESWSELGEPSRFKLSNLLKWCLPNLIILYKTGNSSGEEDVWSAWGSIVGDWEGSQKRKNPTVKDLIRRGIPHHFRAIVWQLLCSASDTDKKQYAEYIKATSACEKVIRRDVARTYPEHDFFKEKEGQVCKQITLRSYELILTVYRTHNDDSSLN